MEYGEFNSINTSLVEYERTTKRVPTMKSQGAAKNEANNAAQSGAAAPAETKVAEKVDFSNVNSSVVLDVELSKDSDDTWFSVDNSDTSESYYLSKTNKSKYSLDLSDKIKTTQIIIAQPSKVTLKVNGESLDLSQLDQNTPSYLTLRIQ